MKQALEQNKIIRYIPTFIKVMETYKKLLEEHNEAFRQCNVSGRSEQLKGKYTEHFIEWRDKYFDYNPILVEWKTKKGDERYTTKQILSRYEKAMCKSPFNCH